MYSAFSDFFSTHSLKTQKPLKLCMRRSYLYFGSLDVDPLWVKRKNKYQKNCYKSMNFLLITSLAELLFITNKTKKIVNNINGICNHFKQPSCCKNVCRYIKLLIY